MAERLRGHKGVAQRKRRMLRTNWLCEHCQAKGLMRKADVVDHVVPLAHGGPDTDDNTRNLCGPCHVEATADQFGYKKRLEIGLDGWPVDTSNTVRLAISYGQIYHGCAGRSCLAWCNHRRLAGVPVNL